MVGNRNVHRKLRLFALDIANLLRGGGHPAWRGLASRASVAGRDACRYDAGHICHQKVIESKS
jgi:hypothetical protein